MAANTEIHIQRLGPDDTALARRTFALMVEVFGGAQAPLSDAYLDRLLARSDFWALAATRNGTVVGGLTAHTLMMTAFEGAEIFLYDIAVDPDHQRRGFGRHLVDALRRQATSLGINTVFVPADDEDAHALDFYRAIGGTATRVTFFEFGPAPAST
jgi:aminoglycoside 3-N-acetyltransferase I